MKIVEQQHITQVSARQRAGRAARKGEGETYRLYTETDYDAIDKEVIPATEYNADYDECHLLNTRHPIAWANAPPEANMAEAGARCEKLGLVRSGELTAFGMNVMSIRLQPSMAVVLTD